MPIICRVERVLLAILISAGFFNTPNVFSRPVDSEPNDISTENEITRLTFANARSGQAVWSPDGSKISFVSNRNGAWEIYIMNADGSDQKKLTDHGVVGRPSWSLDGNRLLFYSDKSGKFAIWMMNIDGSEARILIDPTGQDFRPCYSPDGNKILFDSFEQGEMNDHQLFVMNLDGSNRKRLTFSNAYDSDAWWSSDGSKIVFHSSRHSPADDRFGIMEIYIMNADGSNQRRLTADGGKNQYPCWSPDGKRIAYVSERTGNRDIFIMNSDGSGTMQLTHHKADDSSPNWSPCGKKIAFDSTREPGSQEIFVITLKSD